MIHVVFIITESDKKVWFFSRKKNIHKSDDFILFLREHKSAVCSRSIEKKGRPPPTFFCLPVLLNIPLRKMRVFFQKNTISSRYSKFFQNQKISCFCKKNPQFKWEIDMTRNLQYYSNQMSRILQETCHLHWFSKKNPVLFDKKHFFSSKNTKFDSFEQSY